MSRSNKVKTRNNIFIAILVAMAAFTFFPFVFMLYTSFKDIHQFYHNFWLPTLPFHFSNYAIAFKVIAVYIFNTTYYSIISVTAIALLASLAAYAFARFKFPGSRALFSLIISLLMIPAVLQIVPLFMEVKSLGLLNTPWAVILPWIARSQPFSILVFRTFFADMPTEIFESAHMDGANKLKCYYLLAVPLSTPVITTIVIVHLLATWNDYIWPLVVLSKDSVRVISIGIRYFQGTYGTQYGPLMAGYVLASVPLLIVFAFGLRQFVQGLTSGAIKG